MIPLHPQPLRDFDYIGFYYHFLTWCCDYRQPLFTQPNHVDLVRAQFLRAEQETGFANIAYCFMPDHVQDYPFTGSSLYSIKELMDFAYEI